MTDKPEAKPDESMATLRRRVALLEVRLGVATDDTYDDLDDVEVQAITGMTMDEHRKQRRRG